MLINAYKELRSDEESSEQVSKLKTIGGSVITPGCVGL